MQEILQGAVFRVHGAIVPVGVGAAHGALAVLLANGVDGHQPQNVRAQGADPGQVRFHGPEGALGGVAADVELIDDAAPQIGVGLENYFSVLLLFSTEVL